MFREHGAEAEQCITLPKCDTNDFQKTNPHGTEAMQRPGHKLFSKNGLLTITGSCFKKSEFHNMVCTAICIAATNVIIQINLQNPLQCHSIGSVSVAIKFEN